MNTKAGTYTCAQCSITYPETPEFFHMDKTGTRAGKRRYRMCRLCRYTIDRKHRQPVEVRRAKLKEWYSRNPHKRLEYAKRRSYPNGEKIYKQRYMFNLKSRAFAAYGGATCACCGEDEWSFLCLDHINGDGAAHRRSIAKKTRVNGRPAGVTGLGFYRWLRDANYPGGYQVLCNNCNMAKGFNRMCPHQTGKTTEASVRSALWAPVDTKSGVL